MSHNPYRSPSHEALLGEQIAGPGQRELTRRAASRLITRIRASAAILLVAGQCSFGFSFGVLYDAHSQRHPLDMAELVVWLFIPIMLLVWGYLHFRINIVAVTCTGVAALAIIAVCIGLALVLCRHKDFVDNWFHWLSPLAILSVLMAWSVSLSMELWVWRCRGLNPSAIANLPSAPITK